MPQTSPHQAMAAATAAQILNLHFDSDEPKAVIFGRLMWLILAAIEISSHEALETHLNAVSDN